MTREDTAARCNDGLDNDCNGFADCDDFACRSCAVPACLTNNTVTLRNGGTCMCGDPESTTAACSDGLDNDCDVGLDDCGVDLVGPALVAPEHRARATAGARSRHVEFDAPDAGDRTRPRRD